MNLTLIAQALRQLADAMEAEQTPSPQQEMPLPEPTPSPQQEPPLPEPTPIADEPPVSPFTQQQPTAQVVEVTREMILEYFKTTFQNAVGAGTAPQVMQGILSAIGVQAIPAATPEQKAQILEKMKEAANAAH